MKHLFALLLALFFTSPGPARADNPITPADPSSVQRGIDQAFQSGQAKVVIPAGIYHLTAETSAKAHLYFRGRKNLEIDATGVTLVCGSGDKRLVVFEQCENITFRGATLVRDPMPFSQGRIVAAGGDGKTFDVRVDDGYPRVLDDARLGTKKLVLNLFSLPRHWLDGLYPQTTGATPAIERLSPDTFRFHGNGPVDPHAGWVVGAPVAWRGRGLPDVDVWHCQGMKIVGVTIRNGAGFCVHEDGGEGGNYYSYTVTYGPRPPGATQDPLMASNADAFHSNSVRHGPTLENCHFEGMNDDGIPIHGQYALVEQATGNQVMVAVKSAPFGRAGDLLRFYDERAALAGEAKLVAIEPDALPSASPAPHDLRLFQDPSHTTYEKLTLDRAVPAKFAWMAANANANGDGFVIRGCTIRNNRARGMLIKACDGLIEDCTVEGNSMGGIVLSPEMSYWNESDYPRNIVIRHNTIRAVNYWKRSGDSQAGALTIAAFEHGRFVPLPGGLRHIIVEDNTFENDEGTNILVSSAEGVTIRDNRFVHPMQNARPGKRTVQVDAGALIWLTECSDVQIAGNQLTDPGPCLKTKIEATPTATGSGFDNGVVAQP